VTLMQRTNPLVEVLGLGQSIWYDNIRRDLLESGELARMVAEDGLRGVTSNPTIFEHAIAGSDDYAEQIRELRAGGVTDPKAIYERLAIADIQAAADVLRPVYDGSGGRDGYVSLEVSPELADDARGTVAEAVRLWDAVSRENLMIKVPATPAGVAAVRQLIGRGINVNVTLLFATSAYERVAEAYMSGLEDLAARGGDVSRVASVASFFVSRIDSELDSVVGEELAGTVAIANAKVTYARSNELYSTERWDALEALGAQAQRLLWASTGTKNPAYSDVVYVEELIGANTVNTVPPATYKAFRDHGRVRATLDQDVEGARETMAILGRLGIDFELVATRLLDQGLASFSQAFADLLGAVAATGGLEADVEAAIADWEANDKVRRLWAWDASLWTGSDEPSWLGWLNIVHDRLAEIDELEALAEDARGFDHVVLLGMGGSSLAPEVFALTFGKTDFHILDSTDPAQVRAVEDAVDLERTLFIVSSKSGSTLEPNIFKAYFFERVAELVGREEAGRRFVAVTDPGSSVEQIAREDGFRRVFSGDPSIGGRYSALSNFGLVPAAAMGLDVPELLTRARRMVDACGPATPARENPGVQLGAWLGSAQQAGRDKLTLVVSPGIHDLGAWLEQLIAESTGKNGSGIVPVDREPLGDPWLYGDDRLFVHVRLDSAPDAEQDAAVEALTQAGHPVYTIDVADPYEIGAEFFRWEIATAVAGSLIGINPFDQPDVEAAKVATRRLTDEYERTGALPFESPLRIDDAELPRRLAEHLATIEPGDYAALLAYVQMTPEHEALLTEIRTLIRDRTSAATCVGFGPRFLHSTGQAYKGGPASGVFLQITCDDADDLAIPGRRATFGVVKASQARGDLTVLQDRGRRALRIHLGTDVAAGLARLRDVVASTL
jgi:transaldolase / glucose-6-phosphate isomerase